MNQKPNTKQTEIHTDGGASIGQDVYTGGGNFIGRDQIIQIVQNPYFYSVVIVAIVAMYLSRPESGSLAQPTPMPSATETLQFTPTATPLSTATATSLPVPPSSTPTVPLTATSQPTKAPESAIDCTLSTQECQALIAIFNQTDTPLPEGNLCEWPGVICEGSHVHQLFIKEGQLTMLPAEIGQLTNLEVLYLPDNKLRELPPEIWGLPSLESLDLSNNQLTTLPADIKDLWYLDELGLSGNRLETLPAEIGELTSLNTLNLSSNRLRTLPATVGNLTDLTTLYLQKNQLEMLPKSLTQLKNLRDLDLGQNRLQVTDNESLDWMNRYDPDWADSQRIEVVIPTPIVEASQILVEFCSDKLDVNNEREREMALRTLVEVKALKILSGVQIESQTTTDDSNTPSHNITTTVEGIIRPIGTPRYYPGDGPDEYCVSIVAELIESEMNE